MREGWFFIRVREDALVSRRGQVVGSVRLRRATPEKVDEVHEAGANLKRLVAGDLPAEVLVVDGPKLVQLVVSELHTGAKL